MPPGFRAALLVVATGVPACQVAIADDGPAATPYRPSVSTPATLSAPGYLEFEAGLQVDGRGVTQVQSVPFTVKLAFSPDWGIRVGGDALVRQSDAAGGHQTGVGDTSIVLKRRFAIGADSAFGLEAGVTLPTGADGITSGKADWSLNGIYSADLGAWHTDINLVATRVGAADAGVDRTQWLWAAALSRSVGGNWGAVGEVSGTRQHGADATDQLLLAASYNVSSALVLDGGVARSLRGGPANRSLFAGFTLLGPRLF